MNKIAATLAFSITLSAAAPALSQVAGSSSTFGVSVTQTTEVATGWSVKKTLMGKPIFNDAGEKIGKVQDLIISTERNVSYVILGAGGFVGLGRHDVAIPVASIADQNGRLIIAGANKDSIAALPDFTYADFHADRARFLASIKQDIAHGVTRVSALEKRVGSAQADAKDKLNAQIISLQDDVQTVKTKVSEMQQAPANRWKEFEGGVATAAAKLRKSIETTAT